MVNLKISDLMIKIYDKLKILENNQTKDYNDIYD